MRRGLAALAVALLVAGCDSGPTPVDEAEAAIAGLVAARVDADVEDVVAACPDDATLEAGTELTCTVAVDGEQPVEVAFVFGDEEGSPAELRRAVIPTADAETYLAGELEVAAEGPVELDCGTGSLLVRNVGGTFRCRVERVADGAEFTVTVTVVGLDGTVRHRVDPTTTTTTTPTTVLPTTTVP